MRNSGLPYKREFLGYFNLQIKKNNNYAKKKKFKNDIFKFSFYVALIMITNMKGVPLIFQIQFTN